MEPRPSNLILPTTNLFGFSFIREKKSAESKWILLIDSDANSVNVTFNKVHLYYTAANASQCKHQRNTSFKG